MPFTPAHAAIVLPLTKVNKRYLSATGLIIGSLAPDFEYFFQMKVNSVHSHTAWGVVYFDLPVTVVLAFVFHTIVKHNLIRNLPGFLQVRYQALLQFDFVRYFREHPVVFLASGLLGAASHVLWDDFTHASGYFVRNVFPELLHSTVFVKATPYPLFYVLQHLGTLFGLAVITLWIASQKPDRQATVSRPSAGYWGSLFGVAIALFAMRFLLWPEDYQIGNAVVSIISSIVAGLILAGLLKKK